MNVPFLFPHNVCQKCLNLPLRWVKISNFSGGGPHRPPAAWRGAPTPATREGEHLGGPAPQTVPRGPKILNPALPRLDREIHR